MRHFVQKYDGLGQVFFCFVLRPVWMIFYFISSHFLIFLIFFPA